MKDSQGRQVIIFHLERLWEGQVGSTYIKDRDLYEEIKEGRKTSEWRDNTEFWRRILISSTTMAQGGEGFYRPLKRPGDGVVRAWFVCGYPKGNLPRLEATITEVLEGYQLEVKFKDVVEVTS